MGLALYIYIIPKQWGEVNGWLLDLTEIYLCNKFGLYILHKMRIAKTGVLWYILITKKEVIPMYSIDPNQQISFSAQKISSK